jgi:5-methyltetrahydropteroyltriglutamate--homocysteine methyltransferase
MSPNTPPFRADHVGSLLRPAALHAARTARQRGEITEEALKEIEDREIRAAIRKQEQIGLKAVTDGEYRRAMWHFDFLEGLDGVESFVPAQGIQFSGGIAIPRAIRVVGKLGYSGHPMIDHFRFVQANTQVMPKMAIPSPSVLHFRGGRRSIDAKAYPDMAEFYRDLGDAYSKTVRAFADAGCRYLQLDEVNLTYLCDTEQRRMLTERGDDPSKLPAIYADMINRSIAGRPRDMTVAMHLCRGNFRSSWIAQGGYEPVAELLFNSIDVDAYFMEYDSERAGGFEPLRFVPKHKHVVLGIMTSKSGTLETKDDLKRRIDAATKFIPLDNLCLSPQCGFASTEEGNLLSEAEQWAKLERVVEVAGEVWQ